jgi:hypothetical protein
MRHARESDTSGVDDWNSFFIDAPQKERKMNPVPPEKCKWSATTLVAKRPAYSPSARQRADTGDFPADGHPEYTGAAKNHLNSDFV